MRDDDPLVDPLREALPPVTQQRPTRDLWSPTVARLQGPRTWSRLDGGLPVALALLLLLFPERSLLLAYLL